MQIHQVWWAWDNTTHFDIRGALKMKTQRPGLAITALLGAVFVQLWFCSSALAQQWVANGQYSFKQASDRSGGTFRLQQNGNDLRGTADHWLVFDEDGKVFGVVKINETTNIASTTGEVLSGQILGDRFNLAVRYQAMRKGDRTFMNSLTYVYEGTIDSAGYVRGTVYDAVNPTKRFGFSLETPLAKYVPPPAPPPPPKVLRSTGKAKPSSGGSSVPTAGPNPAPWVNLIGKWETQAGGKTIMMDLTQNGDLVEGRYDVVAAAPVDGSLIGRITPEGRLMFSWKQSDSAGDGTFMPDRNCMQLNGGFTSKTPAVASGAWVGKRTNADPPRAPRAQAFPVFPPIPQYQPQILKNEQTKVLNRLYNGKWVVKTKAGAEFTITFAQNGNSVTGTYQPKNGKIDGTVADDGLLTYKWSDESGATGSGIFAIYEGAQLVGTYSISQNPYEVSGGWAGGRTN
jgi:hypothetical protein